MGRFSPGARHGAPALLFSGALTEPRKRVPLLLEAAALLRRDIPDLEVWLSGPGDPSDLVRSAPKLAQEAVVTLGLGGPADLASQYASAWVTVLPSQNEAFGLALLESLACGTPIVTVDDAGGPADLVNPDVGAIGAPDAESLADACRSALELSQTAGIGEVCRAAAEPFDWYTGIAPRMEEAYQVVGSP